MLSLAVGKGLGMADRKHILHHGQRFVAMLHGDLFFQHTDDVSHRAVHVWKLHGMMTIKVLSSLCTILIWSSGCSRVIHQQHT